MPHYFLDIRNGNGFTADLEGQDQAGLAEAVAAARTGARSLMAADLAEGHLDTSGSIDVCDSEHVLLVTVTFAEVLAAATLNHPPSPPTAR
ncbi:MAG: hypothetical protein ABW203_06315 [Novosphingobium sp.]